MKNIVNSRFGHVQFVSLLALGKGGISFILT